MANVFRHPNRRPPEPVIRRRSDVVAYVDGSMDITIMTHREQMELYELTKHSAVLYGMNYALATQLGISTDPEEMSA